MHEFQNFVYFSLSNLEFSQDVSEEANAKNVELAGYKIHASPEELRKPRIVRIGAVQNKIVLPTTAPVAEQVVTYFWTIFM